MQPCTAEELANAARNFSPLLSSAACRFALSRVLLSEPLRYSVHHGCCNAVAVGRKPRRKETSRIASCERGLLCAEVYPRMHRHGGTSSAPPPSLLRPQKLHPCHCARELLSSVVEESKGSWRPREVTKVGAEWISDIEADRNFLIDFSYPAFTSREFDR